MPSRSSINAATCDTVFVTGVDVRQYSRLVAQDDEQRRHEAVVGRVSTQVLVDVTRQHKRMGIDIRVAPDQRLHVGREQRRRHAFARHVRHCNSVRPFGNSITSK
jgi:hypothetical protein